MPNPSERSRPKLLFVVNVFQPDQLGGAVIFTDLAQGLLESGIEVKVRCAYPYYPEWKDKSGMNGWSTTDEMLDRLPITRYGLFIPKNPKSLVQRLLYELSFFLSLSRNWSEIKNSDIIMVFCPLVGAVGFGRLAKFVSKKPIWLNVQDLPAQAAQAGNISSKGTGGIFSWIQRKLFGGYDIWSTISPVMEESLSKDNPKTVPIKYIPNYLNKSLAAICNSLPSKTSFPKKTLKLFYSGNIGSKQDLIRFCQLLSKSKSDFVFRIHGGGSDSSIVRDWVADIADDRFIFGGFLEEKEFIRTLHESDFCVVTEKSGSGGSFIPSKIIPAVSSQCPVLAISDKESPIGREIAEYEFGPHFEWISFENNVDGILANVADPVLYSTWLRNASVRALFYSREKVIEQYRNEIFLLHTKGDN